MIKQINHWIENGAPYREGVLLYDQYGTDHFLKVLFNRAENSFNKKKLMQALKALTWKIEVIEDPSLISTYHDDSVDAGRSILEALNVKPEIVGYANKKLDPITEAPFQQPPLLKIIKEIDNSYAEIRGLHPYLRVYPEGPKLHELALTIVKLGKRNAELWDRRNYINENGTDLPEHLPAAPLVPVMIDLNLLNKREMIRKSLNKAENRLKKQNPKKPKTIALVEERTQDLARIDQEIAEAKKGAAHE